MQTMSDRVSILIPLYNAEDWLAETLACAVGQTWPNKEIIVVDDGSTDDSPRIARKFEGSGVRVITQGNKGACAARNRALAEASGDYIQFLDADDLMAPNKLEVQIRRLTRSEPLAIAAAAWERFYDVPDEKSLPDVTFEKKSFYGDRETGLDWAVDAVGHNGMFPPHAWLCPREVIEAAGSWNESLLINQDGEYFNRVALESSGVVFCEEARVYYRSGLPGSISRRRSDDSLRSHFRSVELMAQRLLRRDRSLRTCQACATAYMHFAYNAYPDVPDLVDRATDRAEALVEAPDVTPPGNMAYRMLHSLVGWKMAKRFRRWYYLLRYNKTI